MSTCPKTDPDKYLPGNPTLTPAQHASWHAVHACSRSSARVHTPQMWLEAGGSAQRHNLPQATRPVGRLPPWLRLRRPGLARQARGWMRGPVCGHSLRHPAWLVAHPQAPSRSKGAGAGQRGSRTHGPGTQVPAHPHAPSAGGCGAGAGRVRAPARPGPAEFRANAQARAAGAASGGGGRPGRARAPARARRAAAGSATRPPGSRTARRSWWPAPPRCAHRRPGRPPTPPRTPSRPHLPCPRSLARSASQL